MLHTVLYFHELKNSTQRLSTKFGSIFNFTQSFSLRIVFILLKIRELSLKVFHKVWFSVLNITQSFSAENCLYIAKIRKLSLKVFHKVFGWELSLKVFHKVGFSFPLSRKIFHLQFSLIFLRKNRSEAFCGSSENILCATCRVLAMGGIFSTEL